MEKTWREERVRKGEENDGIVGFVLTLTTEIHVCQRKWFVVIY